MSIRSIPIVLLGLGLAANVSAADTRYTVIDLGTLGGQNSLASGINNHGDIVGTSDLPGRPGSQRYHAFLYSNGVMTDLGASRGIDSLSTASAINNNGEVVGLSQDVGHAFRYADGQMTDLGTLTPGDAYSEATGINDQGQAVGHSGSHAVLYDHASIVDIGTLGGTTAEAYGINESSEIVGVSDIAGDASRHAFLYGAGTMNDLGTLGGKYSTASAINNLGQVVGNADTAFISPDTNSPIQHAFLYSNGTMIDLGSLGLSVGNSWATAINNRGTIIGYSEKKPPGIVCYLNPSYENCYTYYPFLYGAGKMKDLSSLLSRSSAGWTLMGVFDINDAGQIVGEAYRANDGGFPHAVLLTPEAGP